MNIIYYSLFGIFLYYQVFLLHSTYFRVSSLVFQFFLSMFTFFGTLAGLAYLVYYGITVIWWAPFVLFALGTIYSLLGYLLERLIGYLMISLLGFIGLPIFGYLMFKTIPA